MKKILTLFFVFFLFSTLTTAQNPRFPGYQGKRAFFELGVGVMSDYIHFIGLGSPNKAEFIGKVNCNIGVVLSRKHTFEFGYSVLPTCWGCKFPDPIFAIITHNIHMNVSSYMRSPTFIAPVGPKFSYGVSFLFPVDGYTSKAFDPNNVIEIGLNAGIGYRTVLANSLTFNIALDLCFIPRQLDGSGATRVFFDNLVSLSLAFGALL